MVCCSVSECVVVVMLCYSVLLLMVVGRKHLVIRRSQCFLGRGAKI